jgi:hypothetical protein
MAPVKAPCVWPGCLRWGLLYQFENTFGETVRYGFCDEHAKPEARIGRVAELTAAWQRTGSVVTAEQLRTHPANLALEAHLEGCQPCREARTWVIQEGMAGRIGGPEDHERIGLYLIEHCCPEGVLLNGEVGKVMAGLEI